MQIKYQSGFTLIELIIVIVILGILATTAAPKFVNLAQDGKAANLHAISGAMASSLKMVFAKAQLSGQTEGDGQIELNGVTIPLLNGYPAINGASDFTVLHQQVSAWLELDAVARNTARDDRGAATFFTDKWSRGNQLFIFYSEDYDKKSITFPCMVRYQNRGEPEITVLTEQC